VAGIDNLSTGILNNLPSSPQSADYLKADITKQSSITKMAAHLSEHRQRGDGRLYVVHTAGPAYDANSFWLVRHVTHGIVVGTASALAASVRAGIDRFVNLSSMARYEIVNLDLGKASVGYEEDDPIGGMTPYGEAKVAAERLVRTMCDRSGIPWTTLVLHNVIGTGQQYNNPIRNVASVMLNLALHGKPPLIYGTGAQRRAYTPWENIERPVLELILDPERRFDGLTVNVGPGPQVSMSLIELATLCYSTAHRLTGRVITPETHPFRHVDPGGSVASMHTAVCSDRRYRMLFGRMPEPDYGRVLTEMGHVMLEQPRDFDYSFVRKADLGPRSYPAFLRKHRLTIK
jgi:UDP-glucose 4-epimerase